MLRILGLFSFVGITLVSAWWVWETQPEVHQFVKEYLHTGEFRTLEVRYPATQIMEAHREELLKNENYSYLEPSITFYPYVLLEVKYVKESGGTGEGIMLWGLDEGEMVIDTSSWEMTHGYEDCIVSGAYKNDFKIINALARAGGSMDRKGLLSTLHVESDILDSWIDSAREKKLIIQRGNDYRLHFENPNIRRSPETRMSHRLVTKPYKYAARIPKKYSISEIERVSQAAFGQGFTIRGMMEVYLPVHNIPIQLPDGSILTTEWNALTGRIRH